MHRVNICGVDTASLPNITKEEADELLFKIRNNNDSIAKERFLLGNLRLVLSVLQRFDSKYDSDDLFQVGVIGLLKALNNFDTTFNVRFSTYAVPMIMGEIRRFIKESTGIRVTRSMRDTAYKVMKARDEFEIKNQRTPSFLEISEELNVPINKVACALNAVSEPLSIYESVYYDGEDSLMLMDQLTDCVDVEEKLCDKVLLKECYANLPENEKRVIKMRYFDSKTQIDIAHEIGVSQAQVSRLETNALKRIRTEFMK